MLREPSMPCESAADMELSSGAAGLGPTEMLPEALLVDLRHRSAGVRARAATELWKHGPVALEPLYGALRDRKVAVRIAAARALGQIGDERAVQPLIAALRSCFVGRSARWDLAASLCILLIGSTLLLILIGIYAGGFVGLGGLVGLLVGLWARAGGEWRAGRSLLCEAITDALVRLAERKPGPEYRVLVPELRTMAVDILEYGRSTRDFSGRAAERLDQLTAEFRNLPLPAVAPTPGASLPLPGQEAE